MSVRTGPAAPSNLHLDVDPLDPGRPLRAQLEAALRSAIQVGRLRRGSRLPASRVLADQLGCSRWVVVQTYEQLTAEGYLTSRPGSGTRVAALPATAVAHEPHSPARTSGIRLDFSPASSDLASFPRTAWLRATSQVMATATPADLSYTEPAGAIQLRWALAERLARVRGVSTTTDAVTVCAGTVHGVVLLTRALAAMGHTALGVEDPGWIRLRAPATAAGLRLVPLPVDDNGLRVSALDRHPEVRAVMVSPAHQFPTGAVLSSDRRSALLHWARDRDALIIEDDYDAEYRYDRRPIGALQALAPDRIAYVGSTSKTLSPALRLGWFTAPPPWAEQVAGLRPGIDLGTSVLDQLALAQMITTGALDRHLRRTATRNRDRRAALVDALGRHVPGAWAEGIAAGLHLVARLPEAVDERKVVDEALRRGIRVFGIGEFHMRSEPAAPGLVLGYAGLTEGVIDSGVAELAEIMRTV